MEEEDEGFYIDDDGVAVILEPIHFKYPYGRDDDEVLHMQPHSNMKEEEFGIKPGSRHKHFKTTRHTDEDGNTHIFNHFKSHNESK